MAVSTPVSMPVAGPVAGPVPRPLPRLLISPKARKRPHAGSDSRSHHNESPRFVVAVADPVRARAGVASVCKDRRPGPATTRSTGVWWAVVRIKAATAAFARRGLPLARKNRAHPAHARRGGGGGVRKALVTSSRTSAKFHQTLLSTAPEIHRFHASGCAQIHVPQAG
jgi:hypothetical protein